MNYKLIKQNAYKVSIHYLELGVFYQTNNKVALLSVKRVKCEIHFAIYLCIG